MDRFASNAKAERYLHHKRPSWGSFLQKCEVHIAAQSNVCTMSYFEADISGLLSLALAQQGPGVLRKLRDMLAAVLAEQVQILHEVPPGGEVELYREQVYDLYLPLPEKARHITNGTSAIAQRRYILSCMLNSDIQDANNMVHCCPYGCCKNEEETHQKMAQFVTVALIPAKTPRFARSRWVNQEPAVTWAGLLAAHHDLLSKILIRWIGSPASCPHHTESAPTVPHDDCNGYLPALPSSAPSSGQVVLATNEKNDDHDGDYGADDEESCLPLVAVRCSF